MQSIVLQLLQQPSIFQKERKYVCVVFYCMHICVCVFVCVCMILIVSVDMFVFSYCARVFCV